MPNNDDVEIGGSVIQRSFVPSNLGITVNIVTVPFSELACGPSSNSDGLNLRQVTAEILGLPVDLILDEGEYKRLVGSIAHDDLWSMSRRSPFWREIWYDEFREIRAASRNRVETNVPPTISFARDSLTLMASGGAPYAETAFYWPGARAIEERGLNRKLARSSEALRIGLACLAGAATAERKIHTFVDALVTYDVPSAQSPKADSDSLLKLIETGKKVCLAPLAASSVIGLQQLGAGSQLQPVLTVASGATMTLILVSTLSLSDLVVRYLMQKRPGKPTKNGSRRE